MFVDTPARPNGLVFVCDVRLKHDRDLQEAEGGSPVLRHWPFGVACLGKSVWAGVTRISLYDYGQKVTADAKHQAQAELMSYLAAKRPACTLVMQTRAADQTSKDDFGDASGVVGTHCWMALKAPDKIPEMAGCIWEANWGPTVGLLNPVNYEYVYRELIRRHMNAALHVATNHLRPPVPGAMSWNDHAAAHVLLTQILHSAVNNLPVSVDIETFSDLSLITAIGLSDGLNSVSVPCEAFEVFGANRVEPAGSDAALDLVRRILASGCPKIFHNYTFDVPMLQAKGYTVNGALHDTMAMHVTVYKQWPHGLQKAVAHELMVGPWKSEHKPQSAKRLGLKKKDARYWICEPEELRRYNALDAFHTWRLARALAPKLGVTL